MKKTVTILLSLVLMFTFTTVAFAASVTGEVIEFDAKANTMTVKGPKKGEVALTLNEKTKIVEGKEKKSLADIKTGNKVSVTYTEAEGKNTASRIEIKAVSAEKKASPSKSTGGY
jgi:Cu/Ag efflux protein CusF